MNSKNLPVIRKSNELIEARYKLSIAEQRLIFLLLSEISPNDENFKDYELQVSDFAKMFGLESDKSLYEKVQNAARELSTRGLNLSTAKSEIYTTWLSYVEYVNGSGAVLLRFDKSLKPYLLQLKSHFTQYDLDNIVCFKSQYSIRLYELLKMYAFKANNGQFERSFKINELRSLFGLEDNDYPLFADFKRRAIDPAMLDVSDKTDLNIIETKYSKTGRKVTSVSFVVMIRSTSPAENLPTEPEPTENHPVIDSLISLGFSPKAAEAAKKKHGIAKLGRNIAYTLMQDKAGAVKNVPAYLKSAITEDWGAGWDEQAPKATPKEKTIYGVAISEIERLARAGEKYEQTAARINREREEAKTQKKQPETTATPQKPTETKQETEEAKAARIAALNAAKAACS